MKITAFNQPIGMGRGAGMVQDCMINASGVCGAPHPKQWIQVALAAAGLASSLYGGYKSSQEAKKAERRQRAKEAADRAWYTRRYNEDYLDTAAGQNLVRRAKDYAQQNWKRAAGAQAVTGGTDAATQMAKDAGNKMVGDTLANIAATDQSRKADVDRIQRANENQYAQMDMARHMNQANNITAAAQGASNSLMSLGSALSQDGAGTNLKGGSNAGSVATTPSVAQTPYDKTSYGNGKLVNGMGEVVYDPNYPYQTI